MPSTQRCGGGGGGVGVEFLAENSKWKEIPESKNSVTVEAVLGMTAVPKDIDKMAEEYVGVSFCFRKNATKLPTGANDFLNIIIPNKM